ncbi:hypothetical protein [[Phormidium] sp. ETS-05]|uniref:hypothetical protein n=1 Tax=[Phormidium] sp. ETS-05 TaxID=222819 RepID=UPI0018EEDFCE|nr:hypothetical protein [[Phormidium] sp. ETS-05]
MFCDIFGTPAENAPCHTKNPITKAGKVQSNSILQEIFIFNRLVYTVLSGNSANEKPSRSPGGAAVGLLVRRFLDAYLFFTGPDLGLIPTKILTKFNVHSHNSANPSEIWFTVPDGP